MPRLIALYDLPDDPEAFDAHYRDVHSGIVARYPNLRVVTHKKNRGYGGALRSGFEMLLVGGQQGDAPGPGRRRR